MVPFRLGDSQKGQVKAALKQRLEKTLNEMRLLCSGTEDSIAKDLMILKICDMTIPVFEIPKSCFGLINAV